MAGFEQGVGFPITAVDQFSGAFDKLKGRVTGMQGDFAKLNGAIAVFTGGLGIGAFAAFVKQTLDAHEEMNKFSQKLGIAVGELSTFKYAAQLSDVSMESLAKGVKGLSQRMVEATDASSKSGNLLRSLGVDIRGGALPAIEKLADTFAKLPDGPTKAALAVELFGKAGMDMIPLLNQGGEGIRKMREEAVRLGLVMDGETARAAEQFNDNVKAVTASVGRLGIVLVNGMAESLVRVSGAMKAAAEEGGLLKAVIVGIGGAMVELTSQSKISQMTRNLVSAQEELEKLRKAPSDNAMAAKWRAGLEAEVAQWKMLIEQEKYAIDLARKRTATAATAPDKGLEERYRQLLGIKDGADKAAKAMKELGLANEHVTAYLKNQADEERTLIALMEHRTRLMRDQQQQEIEEIDARDAVLDRLEDGNAMLRVENTTLGMTEKARQLYVLTLQEESDLKSALTPKDEAHIRALYAERRALLDTQQTLVEQASVWNQLGDAAGVFFSDLVMNGRSAFDNLKRMLKSFLAEMLAIFAKKWVLNMVGQGGMAGQVGQGSLAGSVLNAGLNWAGTGTGVLSSAVAGGSEFLAGAAGTFMGPAAPGSAAAMGAEFGAFMMNPATIAVLAAVAIAVALRNRQGGPKEGGSYFGAYDSSGNFIGDRSVPGTDNGRFFTPTGGDSSMRQFGDTIAQGFFDTLRRLGGSTGGLDFGFGFDKDPRGSADSRVSAMVRDASGNVVYSGLSSAGRDDADFDRALGIEAKRAILAALQASALPDAVAAILAPLDAMAATVDEVDAALTAAQAMADIISALASLDIPGIDIDVLQAFQRDGEALSETLQRVGGQWGTYTQLFTTDAERMVAAQGQITDTFGRLGIAVPDSMEAFKGLVEGLDLTTEAGRAMWEALMEVAPAFASVANAATQAAADAAAAAASMMTSFHSVMGQIRGPAYTRGVQQGQLDTALGQFRDANAWAGGYDNQGLLGQLLTITDADMADYARLKPESAELITQILNLYHSLTSLTDPISTVATTVGTVLAPAVDTAAIAADHLNTKLGLLAQIYELNGDAVSAAAIKEHQRAIALDEIRRQDAAAGTIGELEGLTTTLWALQDAAAAAAEEAARQAETARLQEEAARGVLSVMQDIVRAMDEVTAFKGAVGGSIQSIRGSMAGFDAVGYHSGQVASARSALAGAGDLQSRLAAGGNLRDAIMGRYQAEVDAINAVHQAQNDAARAAIDSANELNRAFRSLGDYAQSLLTGDLSALSPQEKLAAAEGEYRDLLARARANDPAAAAQLQGAASTFLGLSRGHDASSGAYVATFNEVQGALAALGARAGPEQVFEENTAAWQASLLEVQTRAIDELAALEALTDGWTQELQEELDEQAIAFSELNLSSSQIAENTKDLDKRIAKALEGAFAALGQTIVATGRAGAETTANATITQGEVIVDGVRYVFEAGSAKARR